jgi:putative ABC transport system ATP-binding protein
MTRRSEAERAALRARSIGMLFQSVNLVDHLTVEQNITVVQRLAGRRDRDRARALMSQVGLADRATARPASLSGGEAARAGLAVALANDPAIVLADEPTGELDDSAAAQIMELLRRHAEAGAAVVIVTHDATVSGAVDREIGLRDGVVIS